VQGVANTVFLALVLVLAVNYGSEGLAGDVLERLRAAYIASVGVDEEEGLDLGHPGDNAPNGNELPQVNASDFTDTESDVGEKGPEV
jgi:hypothetical protein